MSLPPGVLAHKIGSSTLNSIFSLTKRNHGAYHILTETSLRGESNDLDIQHKLNGLTLQNPRQGHGTSLVQGIETLGLGFSTIQQYNCHLNVIWQLLRSVH